MTIGTEPPIIRYVFTVPAEFSFNFRITKEESMAVSHIDSATGETKLLALNVDYTITLTPGVDGGVFFISNAELAAGFVEARRNEPIDQLVNYVNNDPFDMDILERSLDKLTMIAQQQDEAIDAGALVTNFKGVWEPSVFYGTSDLVQYPDAVGNQYFCNQDHTSSSSFETDMANGTWSLYLDVAFINAAAVIALASAEAAAISELNAANSAGIAVPAAASALASADSASLSQISANSSELFAREWASNPENNLVNDGINPPNFSAFHYMKKAEILVAAGVQLRNGIVSGTGDVVADFNAMDWTGHIHAVGTAFEILNNNIAQFNHAGNLYDWFGVKGVTVGSGGNYTAVASDLFLTVATSAESVSFNPNNSPLVSTTVQAAIDETANVAIPAATAAVKTGFKNVLINGDFRVNQRGFDGNWLALGSNAYGYDRWSRISTHFEQKIEAVNLSQDVTAYYTLSWTGGGDARVLEGGSERLVGPSPLTFQPWQLMSIQQLNITFPNTSTFMQLEQGTVATDFEVRNIQQELAMCQRYYWRGKQDSDGSGRRYGAAGNSQMIGLTIKYPVSMRATPVFAQISAPTYDNCAFSDALAYLESYIIRVAVTATGTYRINGGTYELDAEL